MEVTLCDKEISTAPSWAAKLVFKHEGHHCGIAVGPLYFDSRSIECSKRTKNTRTAPVALAPKVVGSAGSHLAARFTLCRAGEIADRLELPLEECACRVAETGA